MNRAAQREQAFSEDIDRVLAGQETGGAYSDDTEYRDTLAFARRMAAARPFPDPEWRAALKARLENLAESETIERHGVNRRWLSDLVRQPVWQATAAVVVLAAVGILVWASGVFRPTAVTPPTTTPTTIPGAMILSASGGTDKASYIPGEAVRIDVVLKNVTSRTVNIAEFPPILSLMDDATNRPVYSFGAGESPLALAPGQEARFSVNWDQRDAFGTSVPAGRYYLELEDLDSQGSPIQLRLSKPVYFDVRTY